MHCMMLVATLRPPQKAVLALWICCGRPLGNRAPSIFTGLAARTQLRLWA
jgi:hypothetical protein